MVLPLKCFHAKTANLIDQTVLPSATRIFDSSISVLCDHCGQASVAWRVDQVAVPVFYAACHQPGAQLRAAPGPAARSSLTRVSRQHSSLARHFLNRRDYVWNLWQRCHLQICGVRHWNLSSCEKDFSRRGTRNHLSSETSTVTPPFALLRF